MVNLLFLIILFPSICDAWVANYTEYNVIKNDGTCYGELAERVDYNNLEGIKIYLVNGSVCRFDQFNYSDYYESVIDGYCYVKYVKDAAVCEDWLANQLAQPMPVVTSNRRFATKKNYGRVVYKGVGLDGTGLNYVVYKIYGQDNCNDVLDFKRFNDVVSVKNLNNETYQYYVIRRGIESSVESALNVSLLQWVGPDVYYFEYILKGAESMPFKRQDFIRQFGGDSFTGGLYRLDFAITGTQCSYTDYKFIAESEFWFECEAGEIIQYCLNYDWDACDWTNYIGGPIPCPCLSMSSYEGDNYLGYDMSYQSPVMNQWGWYSNYYKWSDEYNAWELWRYPVNKKFEAVGPLEFVTSVAAGFPPWGYITTPGGDDIATDVLLEKGYKYRFRADVDGLIWSYDIGGWPCLVSEVKGSPMPIKGNIAKSEGNIIKLPSAIFKGLQWKK